MQKNKNHHLGIDVPTEGGNAPMEWGSDAIAETISRLDIPYVALNPGASFRGMHDSIVNFLGNRNPEMLLCLHEDHVVSIAHGYAKVTGRPMAAFLHSNVGLMHGAMSIFNAWCDRVPMLVLGATGAVDAHKRRPWIEWLHTSRDQGAMVRHYVKWDDQPASVEAAVESLLRARQLTETAPYAPVYVCFDMSNQEEKLNREITIPDAARFMPHPAPSPDRDQLKKVAEQLSKASRPVILAGRVTRTEEGWNQRIELAERTGAVVMTDLRVAAAFPTAHRNHPLPPVAINVSPDVFDVLREADLILSLDWLDLGGLLKTAKPDLDISARVISCSLDHVVHNGWSCDHMGLPPTDMSIQTTPEQLVAELLDVLPEQDARAPWWEKKTAPRPVEKPHEDAIHIAEMADCVNRVVADRKVCMVRLPIGWPNDRITAAHPLDYLGGDGGAGLAAGPGLAVGAALALRDSGRIAVGILGDGDFVMGASALWTAAHYELPLLIILANNRSFYNDEMHQERVARLRQRPVENKWIGQHIDGPAIDNAALASAQGFESAEVSSLDDLEGALEKAFSAVEAGGRYLLDVRVLPGYA